MTRLKAFMFLVILIGSLLPMGARAQIGDNSRLIERLENELTVTDEVLLRALEIVRSANDETAIRLLKVAHERQAWAKLQLPELRRQFRLRLHGLAMTATQKAREQARNAITRVRRTDRHEGVIMRRLERAEELVNRAAETLAASQDRPGMQRLLQTARDNLVRAWEFFHNAQYRPALKMTNQTARLAERILQTSRGDQSGAEGFERKQEGVNRLLEEAQQLAQECPWIEPRLQAAEESFLQAVAMSDNGQFDNALRQLGKARELTNQAIRDCRGMEEIRQGLDRLQNEYKQITELGAQFGSTQTDSFKAMLRQAQEQIALAQEYASQNQHDAAKISMQAAVRALNQARRIAEGL